MEYKVSWYQFTEHPDSDSCWSLSVGPDGRIYAAACCEGMPGGTVKVVRYNEKTDALDYLWLQNLWGYSRLRCLRTGRENALICPSGYGGES